MADSAPYFMAATIAVLLVVLLVFAMKYTAQAFRARAEAARSTDTGTRLAALDTRSQDHERRLARIETLLREVE